MSKEPIEFVKGQEVLVKATVIRDGPDNDNDLRISIIDKDGASNPNIVYAALSEVIPVEQPKPIDHDAKPIDHDAIQVGDEVAVRALIVKVDRQSDLIYLLKSNVGTREYLGLFPKSAIVSHTPTIPTPPTTAAELAKLPPVVAERVYAELLRKAAKS